MTKHIQLALSIIFCFLFQLAQSQETIKTMFYNLLNFSEAPPSDRPAILNDILATYEPDIFMVAELQTSSDRDLILNNSFNYTTQNMAGAAFVGNTSGFDGINQLVFYDDDKMDLISSQQIQTNVRDINHYKFELNTVNQEIIDVFVAHFKAAQGDSNVQERLAEANAFVNYAAANLDANSNVIFGGDFNFYTDQEPGFQTILFGTQTINFLDPINRIGEWNSNSSFQDVHTQSTRRSNNDFGDFGAGGGLDDRFDFIFISENLSLSTNPVRYVENSYEAYGNNNNCYNDDINFSNCTGNFSQELRDLLYNMSDHLPVVMSIEINSDFLNAKPFEISQQIQFLNGNVNQERLDLLFESKLVGKYLVFYNQLGQLVHKTSINQTTLNVPISNLSSGVYFLKIEGLNGTLKFFKTN